MKAALLAVWAAATLAAAKPHGNSHRHLHDKKAMHAHGPELVKRNPQSGYGDDPLEGPATWVCNLGGRILSEDECREGMRNGTLRSDEGEIPTWSPPPQTTSSSISSTWISTSYSTPSSSSTPSPSSYASSSSSSSSNSDENVAIAAASASSSGDSSSSSASSYSGAGGNGVDSDFPDGQLDCSDFPDEYGAMAVNYLGLGGWTGVQCPGDSSGGGFNNIETVTSGGCREGCFCSYACPAGYQKMQWPSMQGLTGQSVGGIQCKNGKLHLTNDDTKNLCGSGVSGVTVQIQNKLPKNCAVCRTDYPGTESMTIPLNTQPGSSTPLTCPSEDNYYKWKGADTSAQYYVNNMGVSVQQGCQWSTPGSTNGNYAPVNLGVGYSNGQAWLAIMANKPTNPDALLNFDIELRGDQMNGKCKYSNGKYCSGDNYSNCNSDGCTVSVTGGTASYVFSTS